MKTIKILFLLCTATLLMIACTKKCECEITEVRALGNLSPGETATNVVVTSEIWEKQRNKNCEQMGEEVAMPTTLISGDGSPASRDLYYTKRVTCNPL
jgi:hypothetical protein